MGCGESKHAVATTESISINKNLKSNSSKKIQDKETSNDSKESTIEKTSNDISTGTLPTTEKNEVRSILSDTLPDHQKNEISTNTCDVQSEIKSTDDSAVIDSTTHCISSASNNQLEEHVNDIKVVESMVTPKNEKEGHVRELSLESNDDYLSVNDTKSGSRSPPREYIDEPIAKEVENPTDIVSGENEILVKKEDEKNESDEVTEEQKNENIMIEDTITPRVGKEDIVATMGSGSDIAKN